MEIYTKKIRRYSIKNQKKNWIGFPVLEVMYETDSRQEASRPWLKRNIREPES